MTKERRRLDLRLSQETIKLVREVAKDKDGVVDKIYGKDDKEEGGDEKGNKNN